MAPDVCSLFCGRVCKNPPKRQRYGREHADLQHPPDAQARGIRRRKT
jgi:hypothetical protein